MLSKASLVPPSCMWHKRNTSGAWLSFWGTHTYESNATLILRQLHGKIILMRLVFSIGKEVFLLCYMKYLSHDPKLWATNQQTENRAKCEAHHQLAAEQQSFLLISCEHDVVNLKRDTYWPRNEGYQSLKGQANSPGLNSFLHHQRTSQANIVFMMKVHWIIKV